MANRRLKILFLTPRFPFPVIGGDRLKPYYLLSHLGRHHDVQLVSFYYATAAPKSYEREIEKLGVKVKSVPHIVLKAGIRTFFKLPTCYPVEILFYTQPEFADAVKKLTDEIDFDIAFAFFMRTAEYLKDLQIHKILIAEDCRTLYQKRSSKQSEHLVHKYGRYWEYLKLSKYEPKIVSQFDAVTLVSQQDIDAMKQRNANANYRLLTNGVDIVKYAMPPDGTLRKGILFAGKLDVWANQVTLNTIAGQILPRIRSQVPDARLTIVGSHPPQSVLAMKNSFIDIHSNVPEMQPYLQEAQVFLHPHTSGSGIQNKLLEAMACGCPVVTTATGIQGIDARNGSEVLIGRSPAELAEHVVTILQNPDFAQEISYNARLLIEQTHSWEVVYSELDRIIENVTR